MVLSKKQEEGLQIAVRRFKEHEPWTCIADYASQDKIRKYTYNFH